LATLAHKERDTAFTQWASPSPVMHELGWS
jgi:hypothetical protein